MKPQHMKQANMKLPCLLGEGEGRAHWLFPHHPLKSFPNPQALGGGAGSKPIPSSFGAQQQWVQTLTSPDM